MKLNLIAYGITKDVLGNRHVEYHLSEGETVHDLLLSLERAYPELQGLASLRIAVNGEYADAHQRISSQDEIVLIPPVSGG
ncbi:MoaD/ThiS family protein [Pontibacter sp. G13]|uniref:MoaD/ThiS family protein n=1 Tax=Pontibacter sp. G13 TaxID=3074898 RepID=UPI00288C054F|nr:MoaD/ThiS family protein [Pontibacter sp. G13]WNJ17248.1 MoaD/ThiS family protein [Pontibacter sp. G13]